MVVSSSGCGCSDLTSTSEFADTESGARCEGEPSELAPQEDRQCRMHLQLTAGAQTPPQLHVAAAHVGQVQQQA